MKILHIVAGDLNAGAARGAYWLHKGLQSLEVESKIFTNSKMTYEDNSVISTTQTKKEKIFNIIRGQLDNLIVLLYRKRKKIIFSSGFFGIDFTKTSVYKDADIIHLHWINAGLVNIKDLRKINKPIVWTMRDMWPMTGGCHYPIECEKYKTGCGNCEQLLSRSSYDLSRVTLNRKKKYLSQNIKLVGISRWLSEESRKSELFKNFDIRTITNNINTKDFVAIDKEIAKEILGLQTDKKIILTGATNTKDFYKGFEKYLEAISKLDKGKYFLCFFGNLDDDIIEPLGFEYKSLGYLNDIISLRLAYSSANVFVAPSIQEAFGKTLVESMSCCTPVVCFDATGPKDIVNHKVNGYKAKPFESQDLATGIEWVLSAENYGELCINAREKVLKEFDSAVVAKKYVELYEEILKNG